MQRKINKYGRYPTRSPLCFFLSSFTTAAKPRQIVPLGCPCCYKRQVLCRHHSKLGLFSPTPLTLHSCIAKHHLLLFCPEQSQLTRKKKKEIHDNSCCQTKAKQKGGSSKKVRDKFDTKNDSLERVRENILALGNSQGDGMPSSRAAGKGLTARRSICGLWQA